MDYHFIPTRFISYDNNYKCVYGAGQNDEYWLDVIFTHN